MLISDDGFLHSDEIVSWLDIAIEDSDKIHHVKIKDPSGKKHHFMLRISSFLEEPDEYIITLEDITELGLLELFESDIYDTDSLKGATDKLRKKLFDQDKKIQKLLTMVRDSSKALATLNYYKGLAISHDGEVVDFRREVLRIKVDRFQLKTIIDDGYTIIRSDFFPKDIISNLKSFDAETCEIELDKFRFLANSPSDRRFLRLEVGDEMDIDLQSNHNHILAKVVDISIKSIAIKVSDITHINERGFVDCVINIFPKGYKYKTTIRSHAQVYRVINEDREGEYKVILFLNLDQKSSTILQEYMSKKQLELIKELRSRI